MDMIDEAMYTDTTAPASPRYGIPARGAPRPAHVPTNPTSANTATPAIPITIGAPPCAHAPPPDEPVQLPVGVNAITE
ncbi:hypothetical protein LV78_004418 [Actinosynnema pretiosum]|nr:hypothetical protein [Actinosynnema pretiosum]